MEVELNKLISEMIDEPIVSIESVPGGGNNKIYRLCGANGERLALKRYNLTHDPANTVRLDREYSGFGFLRKHGETRVPQPIAIHRQSVCAIYEWIDGEKLKKISNADLDAVIAFVKRLQVYSALPEAKALSPAADNALKLTSVIEQINRRLDRLNTVSDVGLNHFLQSQYLPCFNKVKEKINKKLMKKDAPLSFEHAILSPSDFGFHNMLRSVTGIIFIDFEYFGWDDPAGLLAQFLWHPGMNLTEEQKQYFSSAFVKMFQVDSGFQGRFSALFPLFGLVWTLILLNEYIPSLWQRRLQAGGMPPQAQNERCATQLQKAEHYIKNVMLNLDC